MSAIGPVVIRAWDVRHSPVGHALSEFDDGEFTVPDSHPLAQLAKHDPCPISFFTIMITEELQWRFIATAHSQGDVTFYARPWISELRRELTSDHRFIEIVEQSGATL